MSEPDSTGEDPAADQPGERTTLRRRWAGAPNWLRAMVVLVVLLGGAAAVSWFLTRPTDLEAAYATCDEEKSMALIKVADDGDSIAVYRVGAENLHMTEEWSDDQVEGLVCLLDELDVSSALRQEISSTTSLMGRQETSEDGLLYRWSYHPTSGISMTIRAE